MPRPAPAITLTGIRVCLEPFQAHHSKLLRDRAMTSTDVTPAAAHAAAAPQAHNHDALLLAHLPVPTAHEEELLRQLAAHAIRDGQKAPQPMALSSKEERPLQTLNKPAADPLPEPTAELQQLMLEALDEFGTGYNDTFAVAATRVQAAWLDRLDRELALVELCCPEAYDDFLDRKYDGHQTLARMRELAAEIAASDRSNATAARDANVAAKARLAELTPQPAAREAALRIQHAWRDLRMREDERWERYWVNQKRTNLKSLLAEGWLPLPPLDRQLLRQIWHDDARCLASDRQWHRDHWWGTPADPRRVRTFETGSAISGWGVQGGGVPALGPRSGNFTGNFCRFETLQM